jgi:hypothetical protein
MRPGRGGRWGSEPGRDGGVQELAIPTQNGSTVWCLGARDRLALRRPMPDASVRLIRATADLTAEVTRRRHTENALSAPTVRHHPELVDRLVELQGSHPADPRARSARACCGERCTPSAWKQAPGARTLVLHGAADTVADPRNGRLLADRNPDARLMTSRTALGTRPEHERLLARPVRQRPNRTSPKEAAIRTGRRHGPGPCRRGRRRWIG